MPPPIQIKPLPMSDERAAREKNQRAYERQLHAMERTQIEKGERQHPKSWVRADWPREQAEKRDQQRAAERASQLYRGRPPEPKPPHRTEGRPADWKSVMTARAFSSTRMRDHSRDVADSDTRRAILMESRVERGDEDDRNR